MTLRYRGYLGEANFRERFKWRMLTPKEIDYEWDREPEIPMLYDLRHIPVNKEKELIGQYRQLYRDTFHKVSKIKKITKLPPYSTYPGRDLKSLQRHVDYMGKKVVDVVRQMRRGSFPHPIFLQSDGEIKILAGRTRTSIAKILGIPIEAIVLDQKKIGKELLGLRREMFLKHGLYAGTYGLASKEYRQKFLKWLLAGAKGNPPSLEGEKPVIRQILSHEKDGIKRAEKLLGGR